MANIPVQNISPGHPRFVGGFILIGNQINSDGSTTPVVDTTTPLVVTCNRTEIVATIDPSDNRKIIATVNLAPGAAQVTGTVTVNTSPALPNNMGASFAVVATSAPDQRKVIWDPAQGGTQGDA